MARLYSRKRGKSRSKKPSRVDCPKWLKVSRIDVEHLIIKLSKEGKTPAQIGLILRDQYGIPDIRMITKQKLTKTLKEKNLEPKEPPDLTALIKNAERIRAHLSKHKQDQGAKRGLQLTESKIRRLAKYYKREKIIPNDWKYSSKI